MRPALCVGIAAIALMPGTGLAAAADAPASSGSLPKASMSQTSDSITLSSAQERTIYQDVGKQNAYVKTPAGFSAKVGAKIPGTVHLHPLPTSVTNSIAATRPFEYAMLDKKLLIVNPTDKKVVDIIGPPNTNG